MLENFRIGIDIIDICRFQEKIFDSNKIFYEKIFNSSEIKYCLNKKNSYESFGTKFAIKESVIKCLDKHINFLDILTDYENGKPTVKLLNNSSYQFLVSVSHEKSYAIAIVISELI